MKNYLFISLLIFFQCIITKTYAQDRLIQENVQQVFLQLDINQLDKVIGYIKTDKDGHQSTYLQRQLDKTVEQVTQHTQSELHGHGANYALWREHLRRPHPSVQTLKLFFAQAAQEFGVPVEILEAIAQVETNWTQIGPSIDQGWGMMHLVQNDYANTLHEAATLLGLEDQELKDNAQRNIRGAAALLAQYAGENRKNFNQLTDWFTAVKKLTGLIDSELRREQAIRYYAMIKSGGQSETLWGETLTLLSHPEVVLSPEIIGVAAGAVRRSVDYPKAVSKLIRCNYRRGRQRKLDTWVNHWIGVGTYASAMSRFRSCGSNASAHFIVRSSGQIVQVVRVKNTAMHAGVRGQWNNSRSIGVEHEVTITNPYWKTKVLKASAQMARELTQKYGISAQRILPGILGHKEMPGASTVCPGNFPWQKWLTYFKKGQNYSNKKKNPIKDKSPIKKNPRIDDGWQGNGSILSYHGKFLSRNAPEDWPNGIRQEAILLHSSFKKPWVFFQWQINENHCNRLKIDAPALLRDQKKVNITIGQWNKRNSDITFSNITLPFVLGSDNTDFTMSNGDWFAINITFLSKINRKAQLQAYCTKQTPTPAPYQPESGKSKGLPEGYQWSGVASINSQRFRSLREQFVDSVDWPYGVFQDVIMIRPSKEKPMLFFQWQADSDCPRLLLEPAGLNPVTVDIAIKAWNTSPAQIQWHPNQKLPVILNSPDPGDGAFSVIQMKFHHPINQIGWVEANCFKGPPKK
jgi:N-acetyl-anhydromuramyl-L-alanine amidase AmpD